MARQARKARTARKPGTGTRSLVGKYGGTSASKGTDGRRTKLRGKYRRNRTRKGI